MHQLFADLKTLKWDFNPGEGYTSNCLLAQRVESGIVYTHLIKSLVEAGIERFTTTHDSLNVMKCDEALARRAVMQALEQAGLTMTLKQKDNRSPAPVVSSSPVESFTSFDPAPKMDMFEELDYFTRSAFAPSRTMSSEVTRTEEQVGLARTTTVAETWGVVIEPVDRVGKLPNPALMSHEEQIEFMLAILKRQEANKAFVDLGF